MWNSKHIFIHDYKLIEVFLEKYLLKYIEENNIDKYFFIRYWQGGPHIRLRYKIEDEIAKNNFEENLVKLLNKFKKQYSSYSFQEFKYDERIVRLENVTQLEVYPNFSIQDVKYTPEIYRYGGVEAMSISEDIFSESSKLANYLIRNVDVGKRYIVGLDLMLLSYRVAEKLNLIKSKKKFFTEYNKIWDKFSQNRNLDTYFTILHKRIYNLEQTNKVSMVYKSYLESLEQSFRNIIVKQNIYDEDKIFYIMISHIHMINNRIGLSPENEFFLSKAFL